MPGRLVMDQHAVQGPDGLKRDPNQASAQTSGSHISPPFEGVDHSDFGSEKAIRSAQIGPEPTAPFVNGSMTLQTGKKKDVLPVMEAQDTQPPELEQWAHTYVPLSTLLARIAQQCYSDFVELVDHLADMLVPQGNATSNGTANPVGSHTVLDSSAVSHDKKLRLMNFAHNHKDRFIKALVLVDWARSMSEMNKLIELRMWLQQQDDASPAVANAIVQLKHNMIPAKMPNPNIQGALELLSTGKAPWMPDLGYIPPKRLAPRQILKTLKDMNFLLSVRLDLHEQLPCQLRNYTVADGRATFVVPDEFEVDLALADEDPSSPFYFIDLRFLFSSSQQISEGAIRTSIETTVNNILASEGLIGCYNYLHDFVLTHRTNLFRRQAFEMARSKWSECIRVETIHRDFVVQYWTTWPGNKSWIHVGTLSGVKPEATSSQASRHSRLGIRWIREGHDNSGVNVEINDPQLTMEKILEQIISSHIRSRLKSITNRLRALSGESSWLTARLKLGQQDPCSCALEMHFGSSRVPMIVRVSAVTGNLSISPATPITIDAEKKLNSDSSLDPAHVITVVHCKLLQNDIARHAQRLGWTRAPIGKHDDISKIFGGDVIRWSIYTPRKWQNKWAIAVTISLNGEKWWVVQMNMDALIPAPRSVESAELLPSAVRSTSVQQASLLDIEAKAIAQISFSNITNQLRHVNVRYELQQTPIVSTTETSQTVPKTTVLCINFNDLMRPKNSQASQVSKAWCHEVLMLTHHGICDALTDGSTKVTHVLKAALTQEAASSLAKAVNSTDVDDEDVSFSESGTCALRLRTDFGEGLVTMVEARLKRVERLTNYIRVAQRAQVRLVHTSVARVVFDYPAIKPSLTTELKFSDDTKSAVQIRLKRIEDGQSPNAVNPQRLIQPLLQKLIEPDETAGSERGNTLEYRRFALLLQALDLTLPLLRHFAMLQNKCPSQTSIRGVVYALNRYRLVYAEPFPRVLFDLTLRKKDGRHVWLVTRPGQRDRSTEPPTEELEKGLRRLWSSTGDGWFGLTNGAVAELAGIDNLLDRLDAVVREASPTEAGQNSNGKAEEIKTEVVVLD